MSFRLEIQLSPQARRHLDALKQFPQRITGGIRAALDRENQLTVGHIQRTKLSRRGPKTLGVGKNPKTGGNRLRGSIRATRARASASGQVVASIGTNVVYAGVHEFGFRGRVGVRAHNRRSPSKVFGRVNRTAGRRVGVRTHQRQVNVPKRAPIATGIRERKERYRAAIERALEQAAEG